MSIFTITSDLGWNSHHLANLKGKLLIEFPDAKFVDLNHDIQDFDVQEATVFLDLCYRSFPKGTIHLVLVSTYVKDYLDHLLVIRSNDHTFISLNNGFPEFLLFKENYQVFVNEQVDKLCSSSVSNAYVMACILMQKDFEKNFLSLPSPRTIPKGGIVKQQNVLIGQVVYVDKFQNVYTNILMGDFQDFIDKGNFVIHINRSDKIRKISTNYTDVEEGDFLALFMENNYLQIAINNGKAAQLLGLHKGSNISVEKDA